MFSKKQLMSLFWPAFIEQTLLVSVGFVSTMMMAGVSPYAVSGVGLVENINMVVINVLVAISAGAAVVVSQSIGAEKYDNASKAAGQAVSLALILSGVLSILIAIFSKPIVGFVFSGADPEVLDNASKYLVMSALSYPFMAAGTTLSSIFRACRDAKTPMFSTAFSNIINIAVAFFCVKFLDLKVYGVGIAILLARASNLVYLYFSLRTISLPIVIPKIRLKFDKDIIGQIMSISIPSGIDQFLFSGGKLIISTFLKTFGTDSITANSISSSIFGIINLPGNSLYAISMTVIGQLYGAKRFAEVRKNMIILTAFATVATTALVAFFLPFLGPFIGLYNQNEICNTICFNSSLIMIVWMPLAWPTSFMVPQMLRATGDVKYTMYVSVITMFVVRVAGSWLFGVVFGLGLYGIWMAMVADWIVRSAFFVPRALWGFWNKDYRKC